MREVSGVDSVAGWFCVSGMRGDEGMAHRARAVALPGVPATEFGHRRDGVCRQPQAAAAVVSCHVADDGAEDGPQRQEPVRHLRVWQLSDGVGVEQKLRSVMIRTGRERLSGRVEVDEAYVGGQKEGARGRGAEGKTAVLVAVEGDPKKKLGRVRFRCVEAINRRNVELFIGDCVEPGTQVVSDGLSVYDRLKAAGFDHHAHVITTGGEPARCELDHVHLVISLLKRWLGGTHQGAVAPSHLQAYLDEFAFRFNRRLSQHRGKLFHRLMQQAVTVRPPAVKALYVSKPQPAGVT